MKKSKIILLCISLLTVILIFIFIYNLFYKPTNIEYDYVDELMKVDNTISSSSSSISSKIIVHITGCVVTPGIVELDENSRIIDAIKAAGGTTSDANLNKLNLAYKIEDGQKIYIPSFSDINSVENDNEYISTDPGENIISDYTSSSDSFTIVNINKASQTEFETLPGIGPSLALKIIEYRNTNGKFNSIDDIKNVPGIGDSKFNNIKNLIDI